MITQSNRIQNFDISHYGHYRIFGLVWGGGHKISVMITIMMPCFELKPLAIRREPLLICKSITVLWKEFYFITKAHNKLRSTLFFKNTEWYLFHKLPSYPLKNGKKARPNDTNPNFFGPWKLWCHSKCMTYVTDQKYQSSFEWICFWTNQASLCSKSNKAMDSWHGIIIEKYHHVGDIFRGNSHLRSIM